MKSNQDATIKFLLRTPSGTTTPLMELEELRTFIEEKSIGGDICMCIIQPIGKASIACAWDEILESLQSQASPTPVPSKKVASRVKAIK